MVVRAARREDFGYRMGKRRESLHRRPPRDDGACGSAFCRWSEMMAFEPVEQARPEPILGELFHVGPESAAEYHQHDVADDGRGGLAVRGHRRSGEPWEQVPHELSQRVTDGGEIPVDVSFIGPQRKASCHPGDGNSQKGKKRSGFFMSFLPSLLRCQQNRMNKKITIAAVHR